MKKIYEAEATALGGRDGCVATADGGLRLVLSVPPEMGGRGRDGNNPEQLFAAGYAASFLDTVKLIADRSGTPIADSSTVTARVTLREQDGGGHDFEVALTIDLPNLDDELAKRMMREAHSACPYSRAIRSSTDVALGLA